jgi:hypothetical protein
MAADRAPGGFREPLARAVHRLTTPLCYLGVLGGLQVALLWVLRGHFGVMLPGVCTAAFIVLVGAIRLVSGRWRLKLWGLTLLIALTTIGPTLMGIVERPHIGLTMEHDGLIQIEAAIDRLLKGQAIYGVDWSHTQLAQFSWTLTPDGNPALYHQAYFPLTILVGVPVRLLTDAIGVPFDYRIVLILFVLIGIVAIERLPITAERRFLVMTAVFMSPLITLYLWAGRNDVEFLAAVLLSLMLLARGHPVLASGALGIAVALKPFAWVAVPFLLLVLVIRWRSLRSPTEVVGSLMALALVPAASILPFLFANPSAFWADTVLYTSGGVSHPYPIQGYGFGELLFNLHVVARRTDSFPFGIFQLAALIPALWLSARAFLTRPTITRWMGGYAVVLLAFTFFARFFNDSYVGVVITLFLCTLVLGEASLRPAAPVAAQPLAA